MVDEINTQLFHNLLGQRLDISKMVFLALDLMMIFHRVGIKEFMGVDSRRSDEALADIRTGLGSTVFRDLEDLLGGHDVGPFFLRDTIGFVIESSERFIVVLGNSLLDEVVLIKEFVEFEHLDRRNRRIFNRLKIGETFLRELLANLVVHFH